MRSGVHWKTVENKRKMLLWLVVCLVKGLVHIEKNAFSYCPWMKLTDSHNWILFENSQQTNSSSTPPLFCICYSYGKLHLLWCLIYTSTRYGIQCEIASGQKELKNSKEAWVIAKSSFWGQKPSKSNFFKRRNPRHLKCN